MDKPTLVVVGGIPGAGKTTLANRLADDLGYIFLNKDGILELMWEGLEWNGEKTLLPKFRNATYSLLYDFVKRAGKAKVSLVIEANFNERDDSPKINAIAEEGGFNVVHIFCDVDSLTAFRRFLERQANGDRHASHPPHHTYDSYHKQFIADKDPKLSLEGRIIELDVNDFSRLDYPKLLNDVRHTVSS